MSAKFAVIDTETTGLFSYKLRADHPEQPYMASFSAATLDENLEVEHCHHMYILPDGWTMDPEAEAINHLSTEFLTQRGIPVEGALDLYSDMVNGGLKILAFNSAFDCKVLRGALRREGMPDLYNETKDFCVMKAMTPICKLPGKRGHKWPKLSEAIEFCGIEPSVGAHDSMIDVLDTVRILRWMKKNSLLFHKMFAGDTE